MADPMADAAGVVPECVYRDDACELWCADSLNPQDAVDVLHGRPADLICVDAPYSSKTHKGHQNGKLTADRAAAFVRKHADNPTPESAYAARHYATASGASAARGDIDYGAWSTADVARFVRAWDPLCVGWFVSITDDQLAPAWSQDFGELGRYTFAPLPLVETGSRVRMLGDGPSNWTCWIVVSRPRSKAFASWGTLPGAYIQPAERDINSAGGSDRIVGGKPLQSMCGIVRDYSRRGQLVVDPCCGAGTTLLAAKLLGRRGIGIDTSRERLEIAIRRLRTAREQRDLFETGAG